MTSGSNPVISCSLIPLFSHPAALGGGSTARRFLAKDWRHLSSFNLDQRSVSCLSLQLTRWSWIAVVRKNYLGFIGCIFSQWQPSFSFPLFNEKICEYKQSHLHKLSQSYPTSSFISLFLCSYSDSIIKQPMDYVIFVSYKSNKTSFLQFTLDQPCCLKPGCELLNPWSV